MQYLPTALARSLMLSVLPVPVGPARAAPSFKPIALVNAI